MLKESPRCVGKYFLHYLISVNPLCMVSAQVNQNEIPRWEGMPI